MRKLLELLSMPAIGALFVYSIFILATMESI